MTQTHTHQDVWAGHMCEVKVCDIGIFGPRKLSTEKACVNTWQGYIIFQNPQFFPRPPLPPPNSFLENSPPVHAHHGQCIHTSIGHQCVHAQIANVKIVKKVTYEQTN